MSGIHWRKQEDEVDSPDDLPAPEDVTDEVSELLAGYALDALSDEDTAYIDRYLPQRPTWQWELAQFQRISGLIAYSSPPQDVPVRVRAGILARIDALASESQAEAIARHGQEPGFRGTVRRMRTHVPRVAWAASVPATILAVVFIMASILMQDRISEQQSELAQFQQEQVKANNVLLADTSEQQVVDLVQSSTAPLARGKLFIDRQDNTAMLVVRDMPHPADDEVYVVWMLIGKNQNEYAHLGELTVDTFGRGQKILEPPDDFNHYPVVRITLEPAGDAGVPTGPEVMTGGILGTSSN